MTFLEIRLIDLIDIVLVAWLLYWLYKLIKGTVAVNIFIGIFAFILFWLMIKALNMQLSGAILDNLVNVGVIAIIIVFQPEIRRFLLLLGSKYNIGNRFSVDNLFVSNSPGMLSFQIKPLVSTCEELSRTKTGALIVITRRSELLDYVETGELINAVISKTLLKSIFFKNSPLHDGAVIINQSKIKAAGCILPVSQNMDLPKNVGLRHRAAMGITESTDAVSIVVSEETGRMAFFRGGKGYYNLSTEVLEKKIVDSMANIK